MVTDNDREALIDDLRAYCDGWCLEGKEPLERLKTFEEAVRAEAAEQARKEAAKKAVAFVKMLSSESRDLWGVWEDEHLQLAIMGGCDVCPTRPKCYRTESTPLQNVGKGE